MGAHTSSGPLSAAAIPGVAALLVTALLVAALLGLAILREWISGHRCLTLMEGTTPKGQP